MKTNASFGMDSDSDIFDTGKLFCPLQEITFSRFFYVNVCGWPTMNVK